MAINLQKLNINQRRAVEWNRGPLLVLAGPGSGKTLVLTLRVAKLIEDTSNERFRILGLTFTKKAADEMRTRVDELVPEARERVLLTTFHSFCADILRQHGSHVGIRPDFTILNQEADREGVLLDAVAELEKQGFDVEETDVKVLPLLDNLMDKFAREDDVKSYIRNEELGLKVAALYAEYRRQLTAKNRLDFASLLFFAYQLLTSKSSIAKQIRTVYPHVCVDEFQDTNFGQYLLLRAIVGENPRNLFVVADDDQIIYQWNGASPERLEELRTDFKMDVIQLPMNYRCPPAVIELANNLIRRNVSRASDKEPLCAVKLDDGGETIRVQYFDTLDEELSWIAQDIKNRPQVEWGRCVVLGRTKKLLEKAAYALDNLGLKAILTVRKSEFESAPLRWLHAMLRLTNARGDREQLRRVCKSFYELEGLDIRVKDVVAASSAKGGDYLRSWIEEALAREEMEAYTRRFLKAACGQIVDRMDFLGFIHSAFMWFEEVESRLTGQSQDGFVDFREERSTWEDLQKTTLDRFGRDQVTLQILLQEFDLSPKSPPISPDAVRCFTIHSAKGMEFDHVYLAGLVEDQLPSFQSIKKGDESREMQEERRNCFVGITRTQSTLTLTYAGHYFGWPKLPSRFLSEMGLDV